MVVNPPASHVLVATKRTTRTRKQTAPCRCLLSQTPGACATLCVASLGLAVTAPHLEARRGRSRCFFVTSTGGPSLLAIPSLAKRGFVMSFFSAPAVAAQAPLCPASSFNALWLENDDGPWVEGEFHREQTMYQRQSNMAGVQPLVIHPSFCDIEALPVRILPVP